jgi:hypothetical protein
VVSALWTLAAVAAAAGCLLPWEHLDVDAGGLQASTPYGSLHGPGIAACAGAVLALLTVADRWARPRWSDLRLAGATFAATLLVAGAAVFVTPLGQPLGSGAGGQYAVRLGVGLPLSGGAGVVLLLVSGATMVAWRRAASRSPASSG